MMSTVSFLPSTSRSTGVEVIQSASKSNVQFPPGKAIWNWPFSITLVRQRTWVSALSAMTTIGCQPPKYDCMGLASLLILTAPSTMYPGVAIRVRLSNISPSMLGPSDVTVNLVPLTKFSIAPGSCTVASITAPSGTTTEKWPPPSV